MYKRLGFISIILLSSLFNIGCSKQNTEIGSSKTAAEGQIEKKIQTEPRNTENLDDQSEGKNKSEGLRIEEVQNSQQQLDDERTAASKAALPKPTLNAEAIVEKAFTKSDKQFDFKVAYTKEFLNNANTIFGELDESYAPSYEDDSGFYVNGDKSQLEYIRNIQEDNQYQYIKEVKYDMGFRDDKDDLFGYQGLVLSLCDEDKDGKIELNDKSSTILETFYPNVDFKAVQEKINEAVAAEKSQDAANIYLDPKEKHYSWMGFSWFRFEDNPIEVHISMDKNKDYPAK